MKAVLTDDNICTGCGACAASCATHAIEMQANEEGFLFPIIDEKKCTQCGLCERMCPVNSHNSTNTHFVEPLTVYAAWNLNDDIRCQSSSGGVFTTLAERIIEDSGVVVGAAFDENFQVRHIMIENKNDLSKLRGSKYVQSEVSPSLYGCIRKELRHGRKVLFSGTPCQVAGMRSYIRSHENIFYIDILCHGVPSPLLWKKYRNELQKKGNIEGISFRNKINGWKKYIFSVNYCSGVITRELFFYNTYMNAFLKDLALRNACYQCKFAKKSRISDLTLADFWGVDHTYPQYDNDKGTSLVLVNTTAAISAMQNHASLEIHEVHFKDAILGNPILSGPSHLPEQRKSFYEVLAQKGYNGLVKHYSLGRLSLIKRVVMKLKRGVAKVLSIAGAL